jgi:hypothetical protein
MIRFAALGLAASAVAGAGLLAACSQTASEIEQAQKEVAAVCAAAVPLANVEPAIGVYITAACASEEEIAKLALDPTTLAWITKLYDELEALAAKG